MKAFGNYSLFASLITFIVITSSAVSANSCFKPNHSVSCETVNIPICNSVHFSNDHNSTSFPNVYNHRTLAEAQSFWNQQSSGIMQLIGLQCSNYTTLLVCSAIFPFCFTGLIQRIDPCRELCLSVKESCEGMFGSWPPELDCNQFQPLGGNRVCAWKNVSCNTNNPTATTPRKMITTTSNNVVSNGRTMSLNCTGYLTRLPNPPPRTEFGGLEGCVQPCQGVYFEHDQNVLVTVWTTALSLLSLILSVLVFLTYILNFKSIPRLESSIYYIALCYGIVGLTNIIAIGVGREGVICDQSAHNTFNQSILISNGLDSPLCSAVFSFIYYFTLCTWSWWLALTFEWSLCSWLSTNVNIYWKIPLHSFAWGVPLLFLIIALAKGEFSGNAITQTCWIHRKSEIGFLIIPLAAAVLICSVLVVITFARVVKLQNKKFKELDTGSIEKPDVIAPSLLVKVGTYITFTLLPMGGLLCAYFYNYWFGDMWDRAYLQHCSSSSQTLQKCPAVTNSSKPSLSLYMELIFTAICMGFLSVFWLLRQSSLFAWKKACCICCVSLHNGNNTFATNNLRSAQHINEVEVKSIEINYSRDSQV